MSRVASDDAVAQGVLRWLPALALALLVCVAFRPLLLGALGAGDLLRGGRWLFRTDLSATPVAVAVAVWALARRWAHIAAGARTRVASLVALGLACACCGSFTAGWLLGAGALLVVALALGTLAACAGVGGASGLRAALGPVLVLLFGLPIPISLHSELVWSLQQGTARGARVLLDTLGSGVERAGVVLRASRESFLVIEECSGLRGMQLLSFVALAIREWFRASGARAWLVVLLAPLAGFALNVVRVALVVTSSDPEALLADHTPQGVAVLVAGTLALYGFGAWLSRGTSVSLATPTAAGGTPRWQRPLVLAAVLAALSVALPAADAPPDRSALALPERQAGWEAEPVSGDPLFMGALPRARVRFLRYAPVHGPAPAVDCLVVADAPGHPALSSLISRKGLLPGPDWSVQSQRRVRLWLLGVDAQLSVLRKGAGEQYALSYSWRLPDEPLWRTALREFAGIPASRARVRIRLATALPHDGELAQGRAKQQLDAFLLAFREVLAAQ